MLAMALPFALVRAMEPGRRRRFLYVLAACLILAGTTATLRKAALIVPGIAVITLLTVHRMELKRLLMLLAGVVVVTKVLAPGALGQLVGLFTGSALTKSDSTLGRTADYAAVTPDISSHLALGRGFGSYDPGVYRLLDNQYLNFLIEVGLLGAMAYLGLLAVAMWLAFRATRRARPADRPAAEATLAAVAAFLVAGALFDAFAFPQVTYTFLLVMALGRVVAHADRTGPKPLEILPEPDADGRPLSEAADAARTGPGSRTAPRPARPRALRPRRP
jgi:O-antigen ligase